MRQCPAIKRVRTTARVQAKQHGQQLLLAAEKSEQDGVIFDHLGDAYFANEQAGKARESWKKALKLFGTDEEEMRSSVLEKLGKQPTTLNKSP